MSSLLLSGSQEHRSLVLYNVVYVAWLAVPSYHEVRKLFQGMELYKKPYMLVETMGMGIIVTIKMEVYKLTVSGSSLWPFHLDC